MKDASFPIIFSNDGKSNLYLIPKLFGTLYQKKVLYFLILYFDF